MKNSAKASFFILIFVIATYGQAVDSGKLIGTVFDKSTGEPIIGVNLSLKGTYMGASTDLEGVFLVDNISPGVYDIEVSMIGYKVQLQTGINILAGETKKFSFELETSILAFGQEIVVIGKKPLLEVDNTASEVSYSSDDIDSKIVENVDEILTQQAGIVKSDNKIHIRGGRADEGMYIVDGVSIKDPLSGYGNTLYINADAIKELKVITGGFNAEYGQAMSGIVDVVTREGGDKYSGSFKYKTDYGGMGLFKNFNNQIIEFNFGGPEYIFNNVTPLLGLKIPGNLSFFISGYGNISDSYLPHASKLYPSRSNLKPFTIREENDWHMLGKLSWQITPSKKMSISYDRSLNINQGFFKSFVFSSQNFPYKYSQNLDHYPTFTSESILTNISWRHTVNSQMFYRVILGRFFNSTHSAVQNKHWTEYTEDLDLQPTRYFPNDSQGNMTIRYGDGFYDYGDYGQWYDYYSNRWSLKLDATNQINEEHRVKGGFDMSYTELQVIDINDPWFGESGYGRSYDIYKVYPNSGSLYLQDQIKYEGMIVNLGLRYDYWFPGKYVQDAINDPETITISDAARKEFKKETFEIFGMRGKGHLSPRIGISHPVSDQDVLYFNYGHFSQQPKGQYIYAKLKSTSEATYQLFGNPNLNPTTTVAYELGVKHKFNENLIMEFKAYYKDQFDYPTAAKIIPENPRFANLSYLMYINMDYARSKGIELRVKQRYAKYFSGSLNLTYAVSKGKSSTPNDNLLVQAGVIEEKPLKENYLSWDKPFRLTLDLNFHVDENEGPVLFGLQLPDKWGISTHWELVSGKRYTSLLDIEKEKYDDANPYSEIAPYFNQFDIRFSKYFNISNITVTALIEIENLFDAKIPRIINPYTGREYRPGDILTKSYTRDINPNPNPIYNPSKYRWPRKIKYGLTFRF